MLYIMYVWAVGIGHGIEWQRTGDNIYKNGTNATSSAIIDQYYIIYHTYRIICLQSIIKITSLASFHEFFCFPTPDVPLSLLDFYLRNNDVDVQNKNGIYNNRLFLKKPEVSL